MIDLNNVDGVQDGKLSLTIDEANAEIKKCEEAVKKAELVRKLSNNKDFVKLMDLYKNSVHGAISEIATQSTMGQDKKEFLTRIITAPRIFENFMNSLIRDGRDAANSIRELESAIIEANRSEEGSEL